MARGKDSPGSAAYFAALRKVFALQSEFLTGVLPHAGERGANDEERCRAFLNHVLPRRYSIGTGFIVSSNEGTEVSRQQDVVIFDEFMNSPLYRELSAGVFPIEMVYATVEVKGRLQSGDLANIFASMKGVRQLSMKCWYEVPADSLLPGRPRLVGISLKRPPRAFVFAYDTDYENPEGLKEALERKLSEKDMPHLHGIVVISKDWFAFQYPNRSPAQIKMFTDNALMRFVNSMLTLLKSSVVREADMDRYLGIETAPDAVLTEEEQPKVEPGGEGKEKT